MPSGLPLVNEWADFMPEIVTIEPWSGYTGGGSQQTYSAGSNFSCRIEMKNHLVVDRQGKTVTARGRVFLLSSAPIDVKDRITLPSSFVPTQPPLIDVIINDDELGNHHITLELG